jgi:uncharacterized membrane protein
MPETQKPGRGMPKGRMEAFTDGVVAIIITIMVLELKVPAGHDFAALAASLPVFLAYVLSYINIGLYWNNHHHLLQAAERVNGRALWANLFLLFWLSLAPFVIRWMDESGFAALPCAAYGVVFAMAAIGYFWLQAEIIACTIPFSPRLPKASTHSMISMAPSTATPAWRTPKAAALPGAARLAPTSRREAWSTVSRPT